MTYSKTVSIFTISTVHILSLILLVSFSVFLMLKVKKNSLYYSFMATQMSFVIWIVAKILKTVSPTFDLRWFFVVFQYLGICILEVAFLNFAYNYYKGKNLPKNLLRGLIIVASFQFALIASNEYHHLFYSVFNFDSDRFGPWFYGYVFFMYGSIVSGIVMIAIRFRRSFFHNREFYLVSLAIIIPLLANVFYLSGYYHKLMGILNWRPFDITPLTFSLSLGIFAYSIYKNEFLDIMPIFVEEIFKHTSIGVLILDQYNQLIDLNDLARTYCSQAWFDEKFWEGIERVDQVERSHNRFYQIQKHPIFDSREQMKGYLLSVTDVTSYMQMREQIQDQVEELRAVNYQLKEQIKLKNTLSKVSARNYVARELHDILGHSMTLTIKLLEIGVIKIDESNDVLSGLENVEEAYRVSSKGYNDLRKSLVDKQEISYDLISLKTEINKIGLVLKAAGLVFELKMSKINGLLREDEYQTIIRFIQEAVTNSVKHGKASEIIVSMDFQQSKRIIRVQDNGCGCKDFIKGNGINGMLDRAKLVEGIISLDLCQAEGFCIQLEY